MPIHHHATCTADYPEKPEGEDPQAIVVFDFSDGTVVWQCADCGAFIDKRVCLDAC